MRLLTDLNAEGMTIVYVTHDPRMSEFAQRLIQMYDGKLLNGDGGNPTGGAIGVVEDLPSKPEASGGA